MTEIPFNRPYLVGTEAGHIEEAARRGWLAAGGEFGRRCEAALAERTGAERVLLTHSATAALEAAALLSGIEPGDEVVLPSFTFVTTASAFALRGATPVFVDIDPETLCIDAEQVAAAIGPATKAIVPVHYAGVGCDMDELSALADEHGLALIEDAAQGLAAGYRERPLGSIGSLGAISFHETKNVTCGEGGALLINDPELISKAETVWDKGTNRRAFERGDVEWYSWVELGSSFGMGEVDAAFLWGQLEELDAITERRLAIWRAYHEAFAELEAEGLLRRPIVPDDRDHNAHMYYLLLPDREARDGLIESLDEIGIHAVFHYVPLHTAPAGERLGRAHGELPVTEEMSARLVRIPLWTGMSEPEVERVIEGVRETVGAGASVRSQRG